MSCCLRSLLSSLERVRTMDGFSRTDGYIEYMVELSSALSVLFTTMEGYYQLPRLLSVLLGMFSTIERYHHHLEEHYQHCRRCSSHWRGKWMIDLLMSFCSTYDISFRCGTDDIPFTVLMVSSTFVYYKEPPRRHSLTLVTGVPYGYWVCQ